MSSVYGTVAWREARARFIESQGGRCMMCGRTEGEIVEITDKNGKTKSVKISLSVHHKVPVPLGLKAYNKIANQLFSETLGKGSKRNSNPEWLALKEEAAEALGPLATSREVNKYAKKLWMQRNKALIQKRYKQYKQQARIDYTNLTPSNAVVLCQRCHLAREKGMLLCPVCKTYYYKPSPKYPAGCYRCNRKRMEAEK